LGWCGTGTCHGLGVGKGKGRRYSTDNGITVHCYGVGFDRYTIISWRCTFMRFTKVTSILKGSRFGGNDLAIQASLCSPNMVVIIKSDLMLLKRASVLVYVTAYESLYPLPITQNANYIDHPDLGRGNSSLVFS
jgi:hypothetical protein